MKKTLIWSLMLVLVCAAGAYAVQSEEGEQKSIKQVMKAAMGKQGLVEKLKKGDASDEEKIELLGLFIDMYENEPPKGKPESWRELSGKALLVAAKAAAGREVSEQEIMEGCNCMDCHKAHKKGGR